MFSLIDGFQMRRHLLQVSLLLLFCSGASVAAAQAKDAHASHDTANPASHKGDRVTYLTGALGSRSASGTATLRGRTVSIEWSGDEPTRARGWRLRSGSCGQRDQVTGADVHDTPMTTNAAGKASGVASLEASTDTTTALSVIVLSAPNDASASQLACGSFALPFAAQGHEAMSGMSNDMSAARRSAASDSTMNHAKMDKSQGTTANTADSQMDHAKMDMHDSAKPPNAKDDMASMKDDGATMPSPRDSSTTTLLKIYRRMLADPVIRERVMTDPALQLLLSPTSPANGLMKKTHRDAGAPDRSADLSTTPSSAKPTIRKASPKSVSKPSPAPMPGMDHSKMTPKRKP